MKIGSNIDFTASFGKNYQDKMNELMNQSKMFTDLQRRLAENAKKAQAAQSKKSKGVRDVLITGTTKKTDITKNITTLNRKISEIANSDEDLKMKTMRINNLQMKIDGMQRILSKIEKAERQKQSQEQKRKIKEKVLLTKEDLTLKEDGDKNTVTNENGGIGGTSGSSSMTAGDNMIDIVSDGVAADSGDVPEIDIEV